MVYDEYDDNEGQSESWDDDNSDDFEDDDPDNE